MWKIRKSSLTQIGTCFTLILGIVLVVISAFYVSSFLAIFGVGLFFWGAFLLYLKPTKYVPLTLLNASTFSPTSNIERILAETNLTEKGRYLPPKYFKDLESSIVFIPKQHGQSMPTPEEVKEEKLFFSNRAAVLITPPGLALSKLFEKELGTTFNTTDLYFVQRALPKLLVEDMELAETADLQIQNDTVTLELSGSILFETCRETRKLPRTHAQVGCLISSAVACVLAKATGKIVTIQKDEQSSDGKTTRIEYHLEGE